MRVTSAMRGRGLRRASSARPAAAGRCGVRSVATGVATLAILGAVVSLAASPAAIDLSALDDLAGARATPASVWDDVPLEPVSFNQPGRSRFYVTGMLGESFATLADPVYTQLPDRNWINRSVLTAGGAAGLAIDRDDGRLRIEAEGRGRDDVTAAFDGMVGPVIGANFGWAAADGWSAMVNVWRDYTVGEQVDLYFGGGVGGGGYRYSLGGRTDFPGPSDITYASNAQVASFAWQAGGGVIWNLSDRVAFDVGYRFFSIDQAKATLFGEINGVPVGAIILPQQFTASEVLFSLRVYEPFRRWR